MSELLIKKKDSLTALWEFSQMTIKKYSFHLQDLSISSESKDYQACSFYLNDQHVICRTAKITPKKVGQFVTIWKRMNGGPIQPFDYSDSFNLLVINVQTNEHFGQFVFPKEILLKKGIIRSKSKVGKLGFRVYPPWDKTTNASATKSQRWQENYFLNLDSIESIDVERLKSLYSIQEF